MSGVLYRPGCEMAGDAGGGCAVLFGIGPSTMEGAADSCVCAGDGELRP